MTSPQLERMARKAASLSVPPYPIFHEDDDGWAEAFYLVRSNNKPMRVVITETGHFMGKAARPGTNLYKLFPSGRAEFIRSMDAPS